MPTIDIDDVTLHYDRAGDGPALLFVHGMCGDGDVWAEQARRFADRFTCVRFDRRGHRHSSWGTAPVSDARHADDAACLITALDLGPTLLVGSSGGAAIGAEVALRHGSLLRGAVLSEPPLFSVDPAAGRALLGDVVPAVEGALAAGGPPAAVDAFFTVVCPGLWSTLDEAGKDRYRANAEIGLADLRSPSLDVTPDDLAAVTVPTLVLRGDRSHPSFRAVAATLAASLADARLLEIEGSGHVTYAEQPDAFTAAVAAFAAELDHRAATTR